MSEFDDLLIFKGKIDKDNDDDDIKKKKDKEIIQKLNQEVKEEVIKQKLNQEVKINTKILDNSFQNNFKESIQKKEDDELNKNKGRINVENLRCFIHPWRNAYALCNYCQKPFCFEDIIKYKNEYYCITDIDKVSKAPNESKLIEYNNLSYISILALFSNFIIFFYYSNQEISSILTKLISNGIYYLNNFISFNYLLFFLSFIFILFQFISGILILVRLKRSYILTLITSILNIILFSYIYLNSANFSSLYIVIISFISFITLIYSVKIYSRIEINETLKEVPTTPINWADVKSF